MLKLVTMFFIIAGLSGGLIMLGAPSFGQRVEVEPDGTVKVCSEIGSSSGTTMICF